MELESAAVRAVAHVRSLAAGPPLDRRLRVTLNFHPDRELGDGSMLDLLAGTGAYVSQFVTGTSNGGLTTRPGGDRWRWEHRILCRRVRPIHARRPMLIRNRVADPGMFLLGPNGVLQPNEPAGPP